MSNPQLHWISNIFDPRRPEAITQIVRYYGERASDAWRRERAWLAGKIIGEPQATRNCSVAELKAMHMVGVYEERTRTPPD